MSVAHGKVTDVQQPDSFAFTSENLEKAKAVIAKYPEGRQASAVIPLLSLAQKQHANWLPKAAMDYVAQMLGMPPMRVYEVATFYTMFNMSPMGRYHVQLCTTTPCWLRGSDAIVKACEDHLKVKVGETTADGMFTLSEAECLGACVNAPMLQLTASDSDGYYEDLTPESVTHLLTQIAQGSLPRPCSLAGRNGSEPAGMKKGA